MKPTFYQVSIDTTEIEAALDRIQRQADAIHQQLASELIMLDEIETRRAKLANLDPADALAGTTTCDHCGGGVFVNGVFVNGICTRCHNQHHAEGIRDNHVSDTIARAIRRA